MGKAFLLLKPAVISCAVIRFQRHYGGISVEGVRAIVTPQLNLVLSGAMVEVSKPSANGGIDVYFVFSVKNLKRGRNT